MAQPKSQQTPDLTQLYALRGEQDAVDREILAAIAKRLAIRKQISALRAEYGLQTVDAGRAQVVLDQAKALAVDHGIPTDMAQDIFETLIDWSHRLDKQWRGEN
jgi:chorismate mutase